MSILLDLNINYMLILMIICVDTVLTNKRSLKGMIALNTPLKSFIQ